MLGALVRRYRDFSAAEDVVQEASIAAAEEWPRAGLPDRPIAWLTHVASRRMTDRLRTDGARRRRESIVVSLVPPEDQVALMDAPEGDDTLELLFLCCHPSLTPSSAIALTLRAIGGLGTAEIARAFMVPEATMAQRISRAKQQIKAAGARFEPLAAADRAARLASVMHVLYLVFNEGYTATSGDALVRTDLSSEAIRLARLLHRFVPDHGEVEGLLALMLLTDARRAARTGPLGELIPLDAQDRALWDRAAIAEGTALVEAATGRPSAGTYALQAAIAAVHDRAPSTEATDWAEILALYDLLARVSDNPMVALSRAVAVAMVRGPAAGLAEVEALAGDARLSGSHRLDAVRAHLLERSGDRAGAAEAYARAAARTTSTAERDYLMTQAGRLHA